MCVCVYVCVKVRRIMLRANWLKLVDGDRPTEERHLLNYVKKKGREERTGERKGAHYERRTKKTLTQLKEWKRHRDASECLHVSHFRFLWVNLPPAPSVRLSFPSPVSSSIHPSIWGIFPVWSWMFSLSPSAWFNMNEFPLSLKRGGTRGWSWGGGCSSMKSWG